MAKRPSPKTTPHPGGSKTQKRASGGDAADGGIRKTRGLAYNCGSKTLTFDWEPLSGHNLFLAFVHVSSTEIQNFLPTTSRKLYPVTTVLNTGGTTGSSSSPMYPTTGDGKVYAYVWFLYTRATGGSVGDCGDGGEGEGEGDRRTVSRSGAGKKAETLTSGGLYNCGWQSLVVEWPEMSGYRRDTAFVHVGSNAIPDFDPAMSHSGIPHQEHDFEGEDTILDYSPMHPTIGDGPVFGYAWLGYARGQGGEVADCGIIE